MTTQTQPAHHHWKRRFIFLSRWLHIYISMVGFAILFFFAVTGLTLNHTEWFEGMQRTTRQQGRMDAAWVKPEIGANVPRLEIVEKLRAANGARGALTEFRVDDAQVSVSFKGPGYAADAVINREDGAYDLSETRFGFVAVINDLHKGRDSGRAWSRVIDVSAVLMTLVSVTGMALIFFLKRYRLSGLLAAAGSALLFFLIYRFLGV